MKKPQPSSRPEGVTESYIVRIYRRASGAGAKVLVGVVERPEGGTRLAFQSAEELWAILARPRYGRH